MQNIKIDEPKLPEEDKPNYTNWDFGNFMKNNPNATPQEIKQFLREKRMHDFMIFGK